MLSGFTRMHLSTRCRIVLRGLLIAVLLIGVAMTSWLVIEVRRATQEDKAGDAIEDLGGQVLYEFMAERMSAHGRRDIPPPGPAWLRSILGDYFFANIQAVSLENDASAAYLGALREFTDLTLQGKDVTDVALQRAGNLTGLQNLRIGETSISDDGLAHLRSLTKLEMLSLSGSKIRGPGLAHLDSLVSLESLGLTHIDLTDDGLAYLPNLPRLEYLDLSHTKITNAGLGHLAKLKMLEILTLDATQVSDGAIEFLCQLPALKLVCIKETKMTPKGIERLKRMLPKCEVEYTGRAEP